MSVKQRNPFLLTTIIASCLLLGTGLWWFGPWNASTRFEKMSMLELGRYLETNNKDATATRVMALRLFMTGDPSLSQPALAYALELNPNDHELATAYGELLFSVNRPQEAEALLKKAISLRSDSLHPRRLLAKLYLNQGDFVNAGEQLKAAQQLAPKSGDFPYLLAQCFWRQHKDAEALTAIEQATALAPNNAEFLSMHGHILASMKKTTEGLAKVQKAAEMAPDNLKIQSSYVLLLLENGKTEAEFKQIETSLGLIEQFNSNYEPLSYLRGELQAKRGKWDEALRYYERALKNTPSYTPLYGSLARTYRMVKLPEKAKQFELIYTARKQSETRIQYLEAELKKPDADKALEKLMELATLHEKMGDSYAARNALKAASQLAPNNPTLKAGLERLEQRIMSQNPAPNDSQQNQESLPQ